MANGFHAVKFVLLDFDKPGAVVEYTATALATLAPVFEGATGALTT